MPNFVPENFETLKHTVFIGGLSMSYPAICLIGLNLSQNKLAGWTSKQPRLSVSVNIA